MRTSWQISMAVPEDLVEEFLLRLPPADPASLVRAALVCKPWCRLISTPRFRRRFREFHRTPPTLGFLANTSKPGPRPYVARFVSTSYFRPPAPAEHRGWLVLDARHGRVLLRSIEPGSRPRLMVWDPVTDEWRQLPEVSLFATDWNAAVFCLFAANGSCDHLDCQRGPFAIVLVATVAAKSTLRVYSSEACAWSEPRPLPRCYLGNVAPTALVGGYIVLFERRILGCDLPTGETFVSFLPPDSVACDPVLMTMEDGSLGVALGQGTRLSLWSMDMETSPDGDMPRSA